MGIGSGYIAEISRIGKLLTLAYCRVGMNFHSTKTRNEDTETDHTKRKTEPETATIAVAVGPDPSAREELARLLVLVYDTLAVHQPKAMTLALL